MTMKTKLLFSILSFSLLVRAQVPQSQWLNDLGPDAVGGHRTAAGNKGDVFGLFFKAYSAGPKIERYDSGGSLLWSVNSAQFTEIATYPNNDVVVAGTISNSLAIGTTTILAQPGKHRGIVWLNENGGVVKYVLMK